MATGFEKFKDKALNESGIKINRGGLNEESPEKREVEKFSRTTEVGTSERRSRMIVEQEPVQATPAVAKEEKAKKEELFQLTIKIQNSTKDKLEWLKYTQKKKLMELAEEAFEDIYRKYNGK